MSWNYFFSVTDLKNPHLTVLLLSFYEYHFNWMWVEITLSAQSIEKSTPA